ncbi:MULTISPECIES: hypothetical protein [unclassified Leucobacter]|uniref:hypothetical protein n=1 Tax=unclassified Leucobacter TaxID=2621730 RepID=UPI00165D8C43|nr:MULTISPECIES: hypothetical protein [unclassified Leucobacter]MBC9927408.1 hypothetical protein [Leucobacter sp. cx-169]
MREVAGPMTFLRPDWALPNAFDLGVNDFPERAELREIREGSPWLEDLHAECVKLGNQAILIRTDLGEWQAASAADEARRRIDAILAIAVEAGGTSWQHAGATTVLLGGKVWRSSLGLVLRPSRVIEEDSYGIGSTGQIVSGAARQLDDALANGPMPVHLVEALNALREARMTDHRDVHFYGIRPVSPRVATALEDHAMEHFASALNVRAENLTTALQRREALNQADNLVAQQLMAPFQEGWSREPHEKRQELEQKISECRPAGRVINVSGVVALLDQIRALPMTDLERADFEEAIAISTNPVKERQLLEEMWCETELLRARHRRVRNAVNHGLPLNETTLNSIRRFADSTSSTALNLALTSFKTGDDGSTLLGREESAWTHRMDRICRGMDWAADDRRASGDA